MFCGNINVKGYMKATKEGCWMSSQTRNVLGMLPDMLVTAMSIQQSIHDHEQTIPSAYEEIIVCNKCVFGDSKGFSGLLQNQSISS